MVEVLLAFNVVVLQRAMVARSHKLLGTHQLSVCLHKEEQPVSLKGLMSEHHNCIDCGINTNPRTAARVGGVVDESRWLISDDTVR
jgi:hypothetical protein